LLKEKKAEKTTKKFENKKFSLSAPAFNGALFFTK